MGVEKGAAGVGVGDDAVGHAVEGVALGPGRLGEDVELAHVRRGRGRGQGRRRAVAAGADEVVEDLKVVGRLKFILVEIHDDQGVE